MKILIIGSGGREHALAWKASQSKLSAKVYVAPGNGGTACDPKISNIDIPAEDIESLISFSKKEEIDLTIVGPEVPLVLGITDAFKKEGLNCFGPSKAAARLEGSKDFMKEFLSKHNIPTASYSSFDEIDSAKEYVNQHKLPVVIKADGLAAGKGVIIAHTEEEALDAIDQCMKSKEFGEAGSKVVIEEFLEGEEASFIVLTDGEVILPLASSQDHKARDDEDKGPNTGGMGAYSPAPVVTEDIHNKIMEEVIRPTVLGLKNDGISYCGFLYAGLMINRDGQLKVLEFNCRFGDPETQPIMMRMKSDLVSICYQAAKGELEEVELIWDERVALGVVMAAGGYPGKYNKKDIISGLPEQEQDFLKVFHAGTILSEEKEVLTNGGRVLCVTSLGSDAREAKRRAYEAVELITWDNAYFRKDIGYRAVAREENG
ncbi:MAG: phosphoribosylamine--glycine ligase [Gammaproteobacteria bacterium]